MENKELFIQLYRANRFPQEFEEYLFPIYQKLIVGLNQRLIDNSIVKNHINVNACLKYLVEEHMYNMSMMNEEFVRHFMESEEYTNHLLMIVLDKVFFNEFLDYKAVSNISKYNPLISSLNLFLNFILNK